MIYSISPSSGSLTLSANSSAQFSINSMTISPFDRVCDAIMRLEISSTNFNLNNPSSFNIDGILLSDENNKPIDCAQLYELDNSYFLFFDVTKMYVNDHSVSHTFYLTNNTNNFFEISLELSFVDLTIISPFETLKKHQYINKEIGKSYQLSIDSVSLLPYLSKPLFNGVLDFDYSLIYDSYNPESTFLFFPKGWKLNILEKIYYVDGDLYLEDSSFNKRKFNPTSDGSIFIDSSKTGLLIKKEQDDTYKLFHPLVSSYKLFDEDGYLTTIIDEKNQETSIEYTSSSITITDSKNNVVSIVHTTNKVSISTVIGQEYIGVGANAQQVDVESKYELNIASSLLSSLTYKSEKRISSYFYQTNTDSFAYNSDNRLVDLTTFDNYELLLTIGDDCLETIIKYDTYIIDHSLFTRFKRYVISRNELKDIETIIYFNDDGEITFNGEYPSNSLNGVFLNTTPVNKISCNLLKMNNIIHVLANNYDDTFTLNYTNYYPGNTYNFFSRISEDIVVTPNSRYMLMVTAKLTNRVLPTKHNSQRYFRVNLEYQPFLEQTLIEFDEEGEENKSAVFTPTSSPIYFRFVGLNDNALFEAYNVYLVKIDDSLNSILYEDESLQNPIVSINDSNFGNIIEIKHSNTLLFESDIKTNQLLYLKNNNTNYFYSNDLSEISLNNNNIQVSINDGSPSSFSSIIFGYLSLKNNIKYVSIMSSITPNQNNGPCFKVDNYILKESNCHSYEVVNDFHGNIISEEKIVKIDSENNAKKIKRTNTYSESYNLTEFSVESESLNKHFYIHEFDYTNNILTSETYHVANTEVTKSYGYNNSLNVLITETDPLDVTTTYSYSRYYEYLSSISKSGHRISKSLSKNLNLEDVSDVPLPSLAKKFYFDYDNKNRLNRIYYKYVPFGGSGTMSNGIQVPNGNETNIVINPELPETVDANLITISYLDLSDYGEQITYQYPNVTSTVETYDKYGRLTNKTTTGNNSYTCTFTYVDPYDSNSLARSDARLTTIVDSFSQTQITTTYSYLSDGKVQSITIIGSYMPLYLSYSYDSDFDYLHKEIETSGNFLNIRKSIEKTYIRDYVTNDVTQITNAIKKYMIGSIVPMDLVSVDEVKLIDSLSRITSLKTKIGSDISVGYNIEYYYPSNDVHTVSNYLKKITYTDNSYISYEYDQKGNIKKNGSVNYYYDDNDQLIEERKSYLDRKIYSYDSYGNVTSVQTTFLNQTTTITFEYSSDHPNLLAKYNNEDILVDHMLNPLNLNGAVLTYVRGGMLSSYYKSGTSASYFYNHEGIRTKKIVNGVTHHYLLNGHNIVREYIINSNNVNELIYIYGLSGIIGFMLDESLYLYEKDIFNNINKIYLINNNTKTLAAKYSYDAYGNTDVLNPDGTSNTTPSFIGHINPFRYRGYYFDEESGYYYCNHRYYVPFIYRWLTMDDLSYLDPSSINGINLFAYCKNNPVMNVDPEGRFILFALLVAAIVSAGMSAIEQISTNSWDIKGWNYSRFSSVFLDYLITSGSIILGLSIGAANGHPIGTIVGINQLVNSTYYNLFANPNSGLKNDSYTEGYLTRWQRLDFVKSLKDADSFYSPNAMRVYGEFSGHMYCHYISPTQSTADGARVFFNQWDERWYYNVLAIILGALGF